MKTPSPYDTEPRPARIAYLINVYPMPSQSFIRRELAALEALGAEVVRYTLRRWDGDLVDPLDVEESGKTRAILEAGPAGLLWALVRTAAAQPRTFFRALQQAIRIGQRAGSAGQGVFRHLIYLSEACALLPWLREERVDHVHAHFGSNSTITAMLCRTMGGPPYSFTAHGPEEFDKALGLGLDEKIRNAAFVVAISEHGRSQLCRWTPYEEWSKLRVVHCGLDPMFLDARPVPIPDARHLVCVGRLAEQKGLPTLIEAAGRLRAEGVDFTLTVVGDGPLRDVLERQIAHRGLTKQVHLAGWQSNAAVRDLIQGSRAMVLPSFAEGLPVVIMESLALRRPVISTYVAGIPELVQPGVTGWLVPASSVEALCGAIREVLDAPVERLEEMGGAGYRRVTARHNVVTEAGKLLALFSGGEPAPSGDGQDAQTLIAPPDALAVR